MLWLPLRYHIFSSRSCYVKRCHSPQLLKAYFMTFTLKEEWVRRLQEHGVDSPSVAVNEIEKFVLGSNNPVSLRLKNLFFCANSSLVYTWNGRNIALILIHNFNAIVMVFAIKGSTSTGV